MKPHGYAVCECRAALLPTELFCERHARMLESDTKRALARTYRPGRKPSRVFTNTLIRALREIYYFETNGERVPRLRSFEW